MSGSTTIRGLERGLRVLRALQTAPSATLHEVHLETGLPKPSLLRVLNTLEGAGMISRRMGDGRYRLSATAAHRAREPDRYDRVAEAASPVLDRLCQRIAWPSDLMVPAGDHMEIRETSRTLSPFSLNHDRIGHRINWVLTAVGRAYLAVCPEAERRSILALLRETKLDENRLAFETERLDAILAETRARGYGTRDPTFVGGFYGRPAYADGLASIAVPLLGAREVYGCINILWVQRAFTIEHMAAQHLPDLSTAAAEIVGALDTRLQPSF